MNEPRPQRRKKKSNKKNPKKRKNNFATAVSHRHLLRRIDFVLFYFYFYLFFHFETALGSHRFHKVERRRWDAHWAGVAMATRLIGRFGFYRVFFYRPVCV